MMKKILVAVVLLACWFGPVQEWACADSNIDPQIYINDAPLPITVQRGQSVVIPLFFVGGSFANTPVELTIVRLQGDQFICLGPSGWIEESDPFLCPTLGELRALPEHLYCRWTAFEQSHDLSDFWMFVCVDNVIDQTFTLTPGAFTCGWQQIIIQDSPCSGYTLTATPPTVNVTAAVGATIDTQTVAITDGEGGAVAFEIVDNDYPPWVAPASAGEGQLSLSFVTDHLTDGFQGTATVRVRATDGCEKDIPVSIAISSSGGFTRPDFSALLNLFNQSDTCTRLSFLPEGETFSQPSITRELALGQSEQVVLQVSACTQSATVTDVSTSGGAWLSASRSGTQVILTLDTTGLATGSSHTGSVRVVAGGITGTLPVTLSIEGECTPISASASPSSLSFRTQEGQNPSAQSLSVRNNCGQYVAATATENLGWLGVTSIGTGRFSVSCAVTDLPVGSYTGTITLNAEGYGTQLSVDVRLEVSDTPQSSWDGSVLTVTSGFEDTYDLNPGQKLFFKFTAGVPDTVHPIQIHSTPQANEPPTTDMLIKKGSMPTDADYALALTGGSGSLWNDAVDAWVPSKPDDYLYYNFFDGGGQNELVEIGEPMAPDTFYVMLYNTGSEIVRDQRLSVNYY